MNSMRTGGILELDRMEKGELITHIEELSARGETPALSRLLKRFSFFKPKLIPAEDIPEIRTLLAKKLIEKDHPDAVLSWLIRSSRRPTAYAPSEAELARALELIKSTPSAKLRGRFEAAFSTAGTPLELANSLFRAGFSGRNAAQPSHEPKAAHSRA